jgi:hypothetical protein
VYFESEFEFAEALVVFDEFEGCCVVEELVAV